VRPHYPHAIRARATVLGVVLLLLNQFWLTRSEQAGWSFFTDAVPYCTAIFTLAVLVGTNALLARTGRCRTGWLTRAELLCVFVMVCIGSVLASGQFGQLLVPALPFHAQYAGQGNHYDRTIVPFLPRSVLVWDPTAVRNFYNGNSSIYRAENYVPWIVPSLFWALVILLMVWTMLCLSTILRRRWAEDERLTFPSLFLPIEMSSGETFWRNRLLWAGIVLAGSATLYNGVAYLYPMLPMLPIKRQSFDQYMQLPPWSDIGGFKISFYFFAIGLSFLMPLDLSFSLWFFYLAFKAELLFVSIMGYAGTTTPGAGFDNVAPYPNAQSFGACMSFCVVALWTARHYLRDVWRTAFSRGLAPLDDTREPIRYRTAIVGAIGGTLALAAILSTLGMPPWIAVAFFVIYFAISLVVSRIRAEFGYPVHDMHNTGPMNLLLASCGAAALGPRTMALFGATFWMAREFIANPMPHELEAMRMAEVGGARQRSFAKIVMLAAVVGTFGIFWSYLNLAYQTGMATSRAAIWAHEFANDGYEKIDNWLATPGVVNFRAMEAMGGGFVFALFLGAMRQRLGWFPFHPLAYAMANGWGIHQVFLPVFIGWLCKVAITRYGGLRLYRQAVPLFLGLVLGEMVVGCGWSLYGIALGIRTYEFWP
jgi:hypothetical protein